MKEDKLEQLINEYEENKQRLNELVDDLEKLSKNINDLIPKEYSPRTRFILEDRVKILTQLYDSILKYRTELAKQVEKQVALIKELSADEEDMSTRISAMDIEETKKLLDKILNEQAKK